MKIKQNTIATEYQVRNIDASGDAIDVYSFDNEADALTQADKLASKALAIAVEKHTYNRDFFCRLRDAVNEYEIISLRGNRDALVNGGWAPEEP
jgi:hypothetical protein